MPDHFLWTGRPEQRGEREQFAGAARGSADDRGHPVRLEAPLSYHATRLPFDPRREILWKALCRYAFQRLTPADGCVLELGAGYGHFINNIKCRRRIAVDAWAGFTDYVHAPVEAVVSSATELDFIEDHSVDFVFASNLFEHMEQSEFVKTLAAVRRKLSARGSLNILQPNYRYAYKEYFDDYTHVAVYSAESLRDFLEAHGFRVLECRPRFLPLTLKSRLPVSPLLVRLYLALPFKPLGKQMFLRAEPVDLACAGPQSR